MHNLLFCAHTLYRNYVTKTFLFVTPQCFVHGIGQKSEEKRTSKKFVAFHNHSLLLTMTLPKLQLNKKQA